MQPVDTVGAACPHSVPAATSRIGLIAAIILWIMAGLSPARAELQFDVFVGYDGIVREASWFPIVCEIFNDGPTFNAVVEISAGNVRSDQVRRVPVEMPTGTRKRIVIPMFSSGGRSFGVQWNARLVDDKGRVRKENTSAQPKFLAWEGILIGALPRTFAGMPTFPEVRLNRPEIKPQVARLPAEQLPDNPIAMECLDGLYLNSEKALGLNVNQAGALLAWVHNGGHLIVSVEQLGDITATPWLQQLLPCEATDMANLTIDDDLNNWVREGGPQQPLARGGAASPYRQRSNQSFSPYTALGSDPAFVNAQMPVITGKLRDGTVRLSSHDKPLIIQATRGRGQITFLAFNPEREPFRSWKNRAWFWSKLVGVPNEWYQPMDIPTYGGSSIDGVFGALIDSRQVRKLPVKWLLLLLVVYLVVIGPFDQWWLKRIGKQMLTWITFPTYVVLFSLLIYFIGYKLRAGETEWNELHVVDILPRGSGRAELRGRTFASVYSSANSKYPVAFTPSSPDSADRTFASLRGELLDLYGSGKEGSRASVEQYGNTFRADIFVPVWTSLLYVNDWLQPATQPLHATVTGQAPNWQVEVENRLDRPLTDARIVLKSSSLSTAQIYELGTLNAGEKRTFKLDPNKGMLLSNFVQQHGGRFQHAVERRRNPLGDESEGWLSNPSLNSMVASFGSFLPAQGGVQRGFVSPAGMDLTPLVARGDSILLAWDAGHSYANPINQFKPPRSQRNSLLRLAIQ